MARVREYNHTRFDGGMTHNKRDTSDLTKLGLISHLDIYRDNHEMHVMPGFVDDSGYGGSTTGVKTYNIKAFTTDGGSLVYALGTKSDGTGSKILVRNVSTGTEWEDPVSAFAGEGTFDLIDYPFFYYSGSDFYYPIIDGLTAKVAKHGFTATGNYEGTWQPWLSSPPSRRTDAVEGFNGVIYLTKGGIGTGISSLSTSAVTETIKNSSGFIFSIASGNDMIGLTGPINNPRRGLLLLWDSASLLNDQTIGLGKGNPFAIGFPSGIWATVKQAANSQLEANEREQMTVQVNSGETAEVLYKLEAVSDIALSQETFSLNEYFDGAMLWYGKVEVQPGTFLEGIWSVGKGGINSQFGVSLLLDTAGLGLVQNASVFGNAIYFAHNEDGSVSYLDKYLTGTYDVPATIETLIYGSDTPYQKELDGVTITTENLPTGGSVVAYYRTDSDDSWVTMGTSNTVGAQRHKFTKAEGTVIGKFTEIEFRFVLTGKTVVKNIHVQITETDDLPY